MASARLEKAYTGSNGNMKKWTISVWIKRSGLDSTQYIFGAGENNSADGKLAINSSNQLYLQNDGHNGSNNALQRDLTDTNAWYHIVWRADTDESANDDRWKLYINGELQAASTYGSPSISSGGAGQIGKWGSQDHWVGDNPRSQQSGNQHYYFDGQMAHFHYCDGYAYDASSFGESDSNGVWKPKLTPTVTYGTNGFFLKFDNSGNMGLDSSGNTNNLTTAGTIKQIKDTPSNIHTVGNILIKGTLAASTATNLNLTATSGQASWETLFGTLAVNSGKWYAEFKTGATGTQAGVIDVQQAQVHDIYGGSLSRGWGYDSDGIIYNSGNNTGGTYASITAGDVIGVALDMDNHNVYFHKNGTYQNSGDPTSGAAGTGAKSITAGYNYTFFFGAYNGNMSANFGNGHFGTTDITSAGSNGNGSLFEYDVPTGYYALNTKNLKEHS